MGNAEKKPGKGSAKKKQHQSQSEAKPQTEAQPTQPIQVELTDTEKLNKIFNLIRSGNSLRTSLKGIMGSEKFYILVDADPDLQKRYTRACEERADAMFEDILDIADDGSKDIQILEMDNIQFEQKNKEVIERTKIRIDARKFMLAKMFPKKYGDKLDVSSNGKEIQAPQIIIRMPKMEDDDDANG